MVEVEKGKTIGNSEMHFIILIVFGAELLVISLLRFNAKPVH